MIAVGLAIASPGACQEALVVVNGAAITRDELVHRLLDLSTAGQDQLEEMINEKLLFAAAAKEGISVSPQELDTRLAELKQKMGEEEAFKRNLASQELTEQGLRQKLQVKMVVEKLLGPRAKVTDQDVRDLYEKNKASFDKPESVTLSIIFTKTKERADEAAGRLGKGESFADVARALSEHAASAQRGGSIGPMARPNLPVPLAEAAFAAEVGKYTQPIKTDDGYFILKVDARTAGTTMSFDQVKDALRESLTESKLQQAYVAWLKEARDKAAIERKWHP
jgi:foldase protein PrsA